MFLSGSISWYWCCCDWSCKSNMWYCLKFEIVVFLICLFSYSVSLHFYQKFGGTRLICLPVDHSPRPRLLNHPNALVKALLGNTVKLNCTGYGAAPLDIKWKVIHDGRFRLLSHDATTIFVYNHSLAKNSEFWNYSSFHACLNQTIQCKFQTLPRDLQWNIFLVNCNLVILISVIKQNISALCGIIMARHILWSNFKFS